ncbi:MAG: CHASE2 domain-containing protein [Nitrospinales bacterium]
MQKVFNLLKLTPLKIGFFLTILSVALVKLEPDFLEGIELLLIDQRFINRGILPPGPEVVIAVIDEKSQDALGRWPWPRSTLAALVDKLTEAGAATIGFDVVFSEKGDSINDEVLQLLKNNKLLEKAGAELSDQIKNEILTGKTSDEQFAESLLNSENTILGYFFHGKNEDIKHLSPELIKEGLNHIKAFKYQSVKLHPGAELKYIKNMPAVENNLPIFSDSTLSAGYFNNDPDSDGIYRSFPMIIKSRENYYPPLTIQMLAYYYSYFQDDITLSFEVNEYGISSLKIGKTNIPVNNEGKFMINYYGGKKTFKRYSIVDIIEGNFDSDDFDGRIVLVGATGIGVHDLRATPFDKELPGVEIHATVIDNILHENYLKRPDGYNTYNYLAVFILGVFLSVSLVRVSALYGFLLSVSLIVGIALGNQELFNRGIWINMVYPSLQVMVVYLSMTSFNLFHETKQKKFIRGAFGQFLSPKVVKDLVENPDLLKLGGKKIRMTAFFSDVAGFSGISEKLTPQQLVALLNEYLTAMTDIIHKHDGTIDKYEGDAIIAFWGAPINNPDHALQACQAALEMQEKLVEMRKVWKSQNRDELYVRMGINTGPMVVGNMGSTSRMDYTMMGDPVNLASRLEGVNKVYGTDIMISNFTYEDIMDKVAVRELDLIRVVGKTEPVSIFELICESKNFEGEDKKVYELFTEALTAYRNREWDRAHEILGNILEIKPDDGPAKTLIERCKQFQFADKGGRRKSDKDALPGPGWDGVYQMTSK